MRPARASSRGGVRLSWIAGAVLCALCLSVWRAMFASGRPAPAPAPAPSPPSSGKDGTEKQKPPSKTAPGTKTQSAPGKKTQSREPTKSSTAAVSSSKATEPPAAQGAGEMTEGMKWLDNKDGWLRTSTFADAVDLCEKKELILCNYQQYCPKGKVAGGSKPGDQWAPYKADGDNAWVQIGTWLKQPLTCLAHHNLPGKDGARPEWGSENRKMPFRNFIACCPVKKETSNDEDTSAGASGKEEEADDSDGSDTPSDSFQEHQDSTQQDASASKEARSALEALSKGDLMVKAASANVDDAKLESAINGTKEQLIDLILEASSQAQADKAGAAAGTMQVIRKKKFGELNGTRRALSKMGWYQYQTAPLRRHCTSAFEPVTKTPHPACKALHRRRRTVKSQLKCQSDSCPCGVMFQYANPNVKNPLFTKRVNNASKYAVCQLPRFGYQMYAFQHAIQYLYKCWSWWQLHPNSIHVLDDRYQNMRAGRDNGVTLHPRSQFLVELIAAFKRTGVQVYNAEDRPTKELKAEWENIAMPPLRHTAYPRDAESWFQCPQHSRTLVNALIPGAYDDSCTHIEPRIAILNRRGTRKLKNPTHIAMRLEQEFKEVRVYYFENKTFETQLRFMTKTDILFTPSGAQCSLIFALPRCGALLLGMAEGGQLVHFYSTMATDAGIISSRVWMAGEKGGDVCIDPTYVVTKVRYIQKMRYDCIQDCLSCDRSAR